MPAPPSPIRTLEPVFTVHWLPPHKVIVHNNDWNTFDEVIAILVLAVPQLSLAEAIGLTQEVHRTGAAVVFRGDVAQADLCAGIIRTIGIRVSVEPDT
ncbi:MAG: ATP-dependent Clp protease adaptor ClpS [Candidatus Sericytochromatia bacterium]|nr:ATP-dependent Clp protease adaptor ClpS [Candidatus Sericytochromatia bacterium]